MGGRRDNWRETFRAFGEAVVEVLRAEAALVTETWARSGRELGKVAGIVVAAGFLALVCLPSLLLFALLTGLHSGLGWPLWGAALAVAALVVVVVVVLMAIARYLMANRFENPVATVKERVADHRAWWDERILAQGTEEGDADGALDTGDRESGEPPARA